MSQFGELSGDDLLCEVILPCHTWKQKCQFWSSQFYKDNHIDQNDVAKGTPMAHVYRHVHRPVHTLPVNRPGENVTLRPGALPKALLIANT